MDGFLILIISLILVVLGTLVFFFSRYKRCPSDKILVIYGKTGSGRSSRCIHGGASFIMPLIQASEWLDLTPIPIEIKLEGALSKQNIRVNTPSTFTVGISTEKGVMENAAERLLGQNMNQVRELARDIIFGQMRVVIATMEIEAINADRDLLIEKIFGGVEVELTKVGLRLINVNIQDVTDESGYIVALGREAAARAINEAKVSVAERERDGEIGKSNAEREQRIQVSAAQATAVEGENIAKVKVAQSDAARREQEAEAERLAGAAEKVKAAQALEEAYASEQTAEKARAERERASQHADIVVPAEIEKAKIETLAEADAEKTRRIRRGEADGNYAIMEADARGTLAALQSKAQGLGDIVGAAGGADEATILLVTEQLPQLIAEQVKAISNLKIDSVTVWDSGKGEGGKNDTANFVSGLVGALPPLHQLTKNVGIELPEFLGKLTDNPSEAAKLLESAKGRATGSQTSGTQPKQVRDYAELKGPRQKETSEKRQDESKSETKSTQQDPAAIVRAWLSDHLDSIGAFDENRDNRIDESELANAVNLVLDWGRAAMKSQSGWFYLDGAQTVGPTSWSDVSNHLESHPASFLTRKGAKFWLPGEVILLARKVL
ncbi:MAG: SPFH domain-containing protein [Opitutales bacterium]